MLSAYGLSGTVTTTEPGSRLPAVLADVEFCAALPGRLQTSAGGTKDARNKKFARDSAEAVCPGGFNRRSIADGRGRGGYNGDAFLWGRRTAHKATPSHKQAPRQDGGDREALEAPLVGAPLARLESEVRQLREQISRLTHMAKPGYTESRPRKRAGSQRSQLRSAAATSPPVRKYVDPGPPNGYNGEWVLLQTRLKLELFPGAKKFKYCFGDYWQGQCQAYDEDWEPTPMTCKDETYGDTALLTTMTGHIALKVQGGMVAEAYETGQGRWKMTFKAIACDENDNDVGSEFTLDQFVPPDESSAVIEFGPYTHVTTFFIIPNLRASTFNPRAQRLVTDLVRNISSLEGGQETSLRVSLSGIEPIKVEVRAAFDGNHANLGESFSMRENTHQPHHSPYENGGKAGAREDNARAAGAPGAPLQPLCTPTNQPVETNFCRR